jgi:hypothetical protein
MKEVEVFRIKLEQEEGNGNIVTWRVIEERERFYLPVGAEAWDNLFPGQIYYRPEPRLIPGKEYEVVS